MEVYDCKRASISSFGNALRINWCCDGRQPPELNRRTLNDCYLNWISTSQKKETCRFLECTDVRRSMRARTWGALRTRELRAMHELWKLATTGESAMDVEVEVPSPSDRSIENWIKIIYFLCDSRRSHATRRNFFGMHLKAACCVPLWWGWIWVFAARRRNKPRRASSSIISPVIWR